LSHIFSRYCLYCFYLIVEPAPQARQVRPAEIPDMLARAKC